MKFKICIIWIVIFMIFIFISSGHSAELVLQPDGATGKDSLIVSSNPTTSYGGVEIFNNWGGTDHWVIEFDLSNVPVGAVINSATLELLESGNCQFNVNSLEAHINLSSWDEYLVTWNNSPAYGPSIAINTGDTAGNTCEWIYFDVTQEVLDWYNGTTSNYGFTITGPAEGDTMKTAYTSDFGVATDRPLLRINYTPGSHSIPTLNEWGMIILVMFVAFASFYFLRKQRIAEG